VVDITIYADPPWFEAGGGRIKRGADRHYSLMKTKDIMSFDIPKTDNGHLYLWVTNRFLIDGLRVMEAWGYKYKTNLVWVKDRFGLGQYFRGQHEICLFGTKGKVPYKILNGKRQQHPTVVIAKRRKHSQKPDEMYSIIEKVSSGPYVELFARNKRDGWKSYGDEV
jgi:N6-adenosine-specific RNA methylase IME4